MLKQLPDVSHVHMWSLQLENNGAPAPKRSSCVSNTTFLITGYVGSVSTGWPTSSNIIFS